MAFLGFELSGEKGRSPFAVAAGTGLLCAMGVLGVLAGTAGTGGVASIAAAHGILAAILLVLAWRSGAQGWAVAVALAGAAVSLAWPGGPPLRALAVALPLYLLPLGYPLLLRDRESLCPWLAAVLAGAWFFLAARPALTDLGCGGVIGALPVVQAALLAPHLLRLRSALPARLALVAAAMLAFITVAIPLQLEKQWITLGWALLAAALAWLHTRVPHRGLVAWCAGLFAAVFARLALNPAVLDYHPRSPTPVLNWYLYAYLVPALCFFAAARLLRGRDDAKVPGLGINLASALPAFGAVLLFLLLNIEIADAFSEGPALAFNLLGGGLAQQLSYTIGWALYAILLLVAGVAFRSRAARVAAILLLTVTVFKAFLHDLASLSGLYKVGSFVGLGACLAGVAVILQKFVLRRSQEAS
jgi:uncharacterized membrane protein